MTFGTQDHLDVDLLSDENVADPYPAFARLRVEDPAHWSERHRSWFLTRYDDVANAFRDVRFSADRISGYRQAKLSGPDADPALVQAFDLLAKWMVFLDDPDHGRLRRLVSRAFTPKAISSLRDSIETLCAELIDDFAASGATDLVASFNYPLTAGVVADMLGVPREDRDRFKIWSDQIGSIISGAQGKADRHAEAAQGIADFAAYLGGLLDEFTRNPGPNLISALVAARDEGEKLTHDEVISTCVLLLFAGHETTTNLLGTFVLTLLQRPDLREQVLTGTADMARAVEEIMRVDGPAKGDIRVVTEDVVLHGRTIPRGSRVILCIGSANRDPEAFERPDELDLARERNAHLGFGIGGHYCLGAPLARMEASIAIPMLFERLPGLRVSGEGGIEWHSGLLNRGLVRLPVEWNVDGS